MITKDELLELAKVQSPHCVSIFVPTHRYGEEVNTGKDAIKLKNELKTARTGLAKVGMPDRDIDKMLQPAEALVGDKDFWNDQSDGLAIFLTKNSFKYYSVPVYFQEYTYVSNEFYLKPLMPLFNGDKLFYILSLKTDEVKMYEGEPYSITDIQIDDVIPERLQDRVGYDHEEKNVTFHSKQGEGMFHGHGDNASDHKDELLQYFKAIDNGVIKIIGDDQSIPLVLACSDTHAGIYREANHYRGLWKEHIDAADKDVYLLHEEAVELLQPYFDKEKQEHNKKLAELLGTGKASVDIKEALNKALQGMVEAVFLENGADIFGNFDLSTYDLNVDEAHTHANVSLMNLLAVKVLEQGGAVYIAEPKEMPDSTSKVNALFRG